MINVHSAGKDQVRDPRSVLSRNNGARLPQAQNVQVIGNGKFEDYEGLSLDLVHVVSGLSFLLFTSFLPFRPLLLLTLFGILVFGLDGLIFLCLEK